MRRSQEPLPRASWGFQAGKASFSFQLYITAENAEAMFIFAKGLLPDIEAQFNAEFAAKMGKAEVREPQAALV